MDSKKNSDGENPTWNDLSERMKKIDLIFEEISPDSVKPISAEIP